MFLNNRSKFVKSVVLVLIASMLGISVLPAEAKGLNSKREQFINKLKSIHIPVIELDEADIFSVVRFLSRLSRRYDPGKTGVAIVAAVNKKDARKLPKVTLSLSGKSLTIMDIINLLCEVTGYNYYIQENAVIITLSPPPKRIESREAVQQREMDMSFTERKLKGIIVKTIDFDDITIETAVRHFQELAGKRDMNIVLSHNVNEKERKRVINLILRNRDLYWTISLFCKAAKLDFRIIRNAVVISEPPPPPPPKEEKKSQPAWL